MQFTQKSRKDGDRRRKKAENLIKIIQTAVVNNSGLLSTSFQMCDAVRTSVPDGATSAGVVTGTGGSSSESAAAAARRCGGCVPGPAPAGPPAGTAPSGGGAPLRWGRRDTVNARTWRFLLAEAAASLSEFCKLQTDKPAFGRNRGNGRRAASGAKSPTSE